MRLEVSEYILRAEIDENGLSPEQFADKWVTYPVRKIIIETIDRMKKLSDSAHMAEFHQDKKRWPTMVITVEFK